MLFLNMYPGIENPFFRSIGSLKMTICSNRKTRLSLGLDRKLLSCSVTVKVSCWSNFPCAVIFPCKEKVCLGAMTAQTPSLFISLLRQFYTAAHIWRRTSKPCSRPTFIMSLQRLGTKHITSTAFCCRDSEGESERDSEKETQREWENPKREIERHTDRERHRDTHGDT